MRLFACACCRRILHVFTDKISRKTIEFAERFADGKATRNDLHGNAWGKPGQAFPVIERKAWDAAHNSAAYGARMVERAVLAADKEMFRAWESMFDAAWRKFGCSLHEAEEAADASMPADWVSRGKPAGREERKHQSFVCRDIFGPLPFRSVTVEQTWLTSTVTSLATAIYQERAFDRLPILADALEDAGCPQHDILSHLRSSGEHVLGCWPLDLVLGKE